MHTCNAYARLVHIGLRVVLSNAIGNMLPVVTVLCKLLARQLNLIKYLRATAHLLLRIYQPVSLE